MSLQEQLLGLHRLEQQVRGLRTRLDAAQRALKRQQERRSQTQQQHDEVNDQLKHVKAAAQTLEHQSQDLGQKVDKLREQMNSVRSNKEYAALLVEVNTFKADQAKLEDQALQEMSRADLLQEQLTELAAKLTEHDKVLAVAQGQVDQCLAEVGQRLDEAQADRDRAAAELPPNILREFDRLADHYDGQAMAAVECESQRNREYICSGCYTMVPIERLNTLMMPNLSEPVTCPSCGRILFLESQGAPAER